MMDWTKETSDPLNGKVRSHVLQFLNKIRQPLPMAPKTQPLDDYDFFISQLAKGKRVLDIGICEHTRERINSPQWKHRILVDSAAYCLGVDIIESLVEELKKEGLNVRQCDATSNIYLGEKFDLIHIGDVIEHVSSPIQLLEFAKRHLAPGGKIIVRTPNPYCYNYIYLVAKNGTDGSNLEHMFYILPTHALEIGRRAELSLDHYYTVRKSGRNPLRSFAKFVRWGFLPDELYTTIFVYEFTNPS